MKKIEIYGGFHHQMLPIRVRVHPDFFDENYGHPSAGAVQYHVSDATWMRIRRHMCGHKGCMCTPAHGWEWTEV